MDRFHEGPSLRETSVRRADGNPSRAARCTLWPGGGTWTAPCRHGGKASRHPLCRRRLWHRLDRSHVRSGTGASLIPCCRRWRRWRSFSGSKGTRCGSEPSRPPGLRRNDRRGLRRASSRGVGFRRSRRCTSVTGSMLLHSPVGQRLSMLASSTASENSANRESRWAWTSNPASSPAGPPTG